VESAPATSENVTCGVSFETSLARDLPKPMTRDPPPCMRESRNQNSTPMMRNGMSSPSSDDQNDGWATSELYPSAGSAATTASTTASPCGAT
jgi:hypothetical protein